MSERDTEPNRCPLGSHGPFPFLVFSVTRVRTTHTHTHTGARGQSAHVTVVDEAGYVDEDMYNKVISPIAVLPANNTLLMLSSPGDKSKDGKANYYNRLGDKQNARRDDYLMTRVIIAETCPLPGCADEEAAQECDHMEGLEPTWFDPKGKEIMRAMLPEKDFLQEALGKVVEDGQRVFNALLAKWWLRHQIVSVVNPKGSFIIYVGMDPSAGSTKKSQWSISAGTFTPHNLFVVKKHALSLSLSLSLSFARLCNSNSSSSRRSGDR